MDEMLLFEALSWISRTVFILIFVRTLVDVVRQPRRENIDIALLFGSIALAIVLTLTTRLLGEPVRAVSVGTVVVAVSLPLMLFRIVDDFTDVRREARWLIWAGFLLSLGPVALLRAPYPPLFTIWIIGYFVLATAYSTVQFAGRLSTSRGARRRRKQAVVAGSALLAASILLSALAGLLPPGFAFLRAAGAFAGLGCAIAYLLGFAPPRWIRRAWQGPEIERFLSVLASAESVRLVELTKELEAAVSGAIGSERALISLWSDDEARLRAPSLAQPVLPPARANSSAAFDVFTSQQPLFVDDMVRRHPENADVYRNLSMFRAMLAPITSGSRRLGVLTVYDFDAPLFPEDDLALLAMMANQIAILLALRQSAEETAQTEARAEVLKLQEEFLAAASHDLRTPLTTILGEAQLLQRRLRRVMPPPPELEAVDTLVSQASRMRRLTEDVLNVMRDSGGFVGERTPADLRALADDVVAATNDGGRELRVQGPSAFAPVDAARVEQVIANLIGNALKFSAAGPVDIALLDREDEVELTVRDYGVGIAPEDLARIFDRFTRGANVVGTAEGVGLGLFICRRIVDGHGGRIWAESSPGEGSTFHTVFPKQVE